MMVAGAPSASTPAERRRRTNSGSIARCSAAITAQAASTDAIEPPMTSPSRTLGLYGTVATYGACASTTLEMRS